MSLVITPVFSVTWSFINHSNMLIWCSRNISYIIINIENVCRFVFFWKLWYMYLFIYLNSLQVFTLMPILLFLFFFFVSAGCKDAWPVYVPVWSTDVLSLIDALECGQSAVFQDAVQTVCSVTHVLSSAIYCHWKVFASAATSCLRCTSSLWFWGWVEHVGTEVSS